MSEAVTDDQQEAFAEVGRDLLSYELETLADELHVEFTRAAQKACDADEITESDARQLANAIERADSFVDSFYQACPDAERSPEIAELLSPEEMQEITEEKAVYEKPADNE